METTFKNFLKRNNLTEIFNAELKKSGKTWDQLMNKYQPFIYLVAAFAWSETEQKYNFWSKVNEKWEKIVLKHNS